MSGLRWGQRPLLFHNTSRPAPRRPALGPHAVAARPPAAARRAGSRGGDSPAAGAEMAPAAVSPSPGGDSRPFGSTGARATPPDRSRCSPARGAFHPGLPSPTQPSRHPEPPAPAASVPPPGLPSRPHWLSLTCHVPNPTTEGGASRPREGQGQSFTADKGRRHVRAGRNRPRRLPGTDFRRRHSASLRARPPTGACAYPAQSSPLVDFGNCPCFNSCLGFPLQIHPQRHLMCARQHVHHLTCS